jgi:hypothetical protein
MTVMFLTSGYEDFVWKVNRLLAVSEGSNLQIVHLFGKSKERK